MSDTQSEFDKIKAEIEQNNRKNAELQKALMETALNEAEQLRLKLEELSEQTGIGILELLKVKKSDARRYAENSTKTDSSLTDEQINILQNYRKENLGKVIKDENGKEHTIKAKGPFPKPLVKGVLEGKLK